MHYKCFDLEILRTVEQAGGWDATDRMGVSCCVVYSNKSQSFRVFGDGQEKEAIDYIMDCDLVVGFNHIEFDWRVLQKIPKSVLVRSTPPLIDRAQYDVLEVFRNATGASKFVKGYKLDDFARENLGREKWMSGGLAPDLWQAGKYCQVIDYCIEDVALTRDLFELIEYKQSLTDPVTRLEVRFLRPQAYLENWREIRSRS